MVNASLEDARKKRPSLKTVASKAGVSLATASYALRNHPKISVVTRHRVQNVAEILGYRTNATISRLMAELRSDQKGGATLAWINCNPSRDVYTTVPWLQGWLSGARGRADRLGYRFEEFWLHEAGMTAERLLEILQARGTAGLIIAPTHLTQGRVPIDIRLFPVVSMAGVFSQPLIHQAATNNFANVVLALEKLSGLGYRRIGLVSHLLGEELADRQFAGAFWEWQGKLPESERSTPLLYDENAGDAEVVFHRWLKRRRLDAILSTGSKPMQMLVNRGMNVPGEIGLAHLNLADDVSGWAGIDPLIDEVAAAAVDLLVGQIQRNESGPPPVPKITAIRGRWVAGRTVQPQAGSRETPAKLRSDKGTHGRFAGQETRPPQ